MLFDGVPVILALVASLAISGGAQAGRPGIVSASPERRLKVMLRRSTTTMHLVADDWTSGAWVDRTGTTNASTGAPAPAKGASANFPGRSYVTGTFVYSGESWVDGVTKRTYELIYDAYDDSVGSWAGAFGRSAASGAIMITQTTGNITAQIENTVPGTFLGGTVALSPATDAIPRIFHIVVDLAAPYFKLYLNGALIINDTTTSGSRATIAHTMGLNACYDNVGAFAVSDSKLVEFLRHEEAFDATTIADRVAQFNALRGY